MSELSSKSQGPSTQHQADDRERLELFDLLLEAAADGFLDWHLDTGIVSYSQRFKMILGYEDDPLPETPVAWLGLTHPEDREMVTKDLEELIAGNWPFDSIFRMKHRTTGWRWVRARAVARRNSAGNATRIVATFSDVDAQVRAERRQASLLNAIPDLLIRVRNDSTVVQVKIPEGQVDYAHGVPHQGELLVEAPFASAWSGQAEAAISSAINERKPSAFEAKQHTIKEHANPCDIEVRAFPSSDEECLLVIRDITAEKQRREQGLQSQKLEAIGQLAAGIAHEINTPLQFVGDNLHFLAEASEALTQALDEYRANLPEALAPVLKATESELDIDYMTEHLKPAFAGAIDGVERVSVIVQAMKAFSHPGGSEKRPEDLNHALDTTLTLSMNVWKYVAEIERDLAPNLPKVDCVIGELNQVFLTLITNAAHAIGATVDGSGNKGRIRITTRQDADYVEVQIADSGHGIPEAIQSRIFDPFFTTKPVGQGTGQGLPLARAIVLQHQGTLEFRTSEGRGTTFTVRVPLTQAAASTQNGATSR